MQPIAESRQHPDAVARPDARCPPQSRGGPLERLLRRCLGTYTPSSGQWEGHEPVCTPGPDPSQRLNAYSPPCGYRSVAGSDDRQSPRLLRVNTHLPPWSRSRALPHRRCWPAVRDGCRRHPRLAGTRGLLGVRRPIVPDHCVSRQRLISQIAATQTSLRWHKPRPVQHRVAPARLSTTP